jgi:hypothetical protein
MNGFMKNIFVIFLTLFIASTAIAACNIDVDNFEVELRSDEDGYDSSIFAEDNSEVDIRITFEVTDIDDEDDCDNEIDARAEIFRWDDDDDEWNSYRTISAQSQELEEDEYVFIWSNEFDIDDSYERYKVEGYIEENNDEIEREEAFIDVENNTCSAIIITTRDFEIDEGEDERETFIIENNTNEDFEIENVDVSFSGSGVTSGEIDYPDRVDSDDIENIEVTLEAGYTSRDITRTGIIEVSGYLGNDFCSFSDIGEDEFDVKIEDTGSSGSGSSGSSSGQCDDLSLNVHDFTMNEGSSTQEIFYLENQSTKRFEILEVEVDGSGIDLEAYYLEKYTFPNNLSDIVVVAESGNVTRNKTYENNIKVRGRFSDGRSCSFSSIEERSFDIIVENSTESTIATCNGFEIDAPSTVNIQNVGAIEFTINNGTNRSATINVESEMSVTPSIITLPANSSITRELNVNAIEGSSDIYFRPTVVGCSVEGTQIEVINTAIGTINSIGINTTIEQDENTIKLVSEFNNPTNKFFVGVISFDADGWISEDKTITIAPGQSFTEIEITPTTNNQALNGTITFTSNGEVIEEEIDLTEGNILTGLFGLGSGITGIGILLLVIIVAIVIVLYITDKDRRHVELRRVDKEPWETL